MIAIIDWRMAAMREARASTSASTATPRPTTCSPPTPDVVIVATGGMPHTEVLDAGNELVVSAWDILSGDAKPRRRGAGLRRCRRPCRAAGGGAHRRDRRRRRDHDPGPHLRPRGHGDEPRALHAQPAGPGHHASPSPGVCGRSARDGNRLRASLGSDYGAAARSRIVDQVVVNHGTRPLDELYFALKPLSSQSRRGRLRGADRRAARRR